MPSRFERRCFCWAAHNVDIEELKEVSSQLPKQFGRKFAKRAIENGECKIMPKVDLSSAICISCDEISRRNRQDLSSSLGIIRLVR